MLEGALWRLGRGEYDLACFEAEQAAQLALKSLLYELLGMAPRIHDLGELLGLLHRALSEAGLEGLAEVVASTAGGAAGGCGSWGKPTTGAAMAWRTTGAGRPRPA